MTSYGSMTTEAFVNWLLHFSHYKYAGPCLLVFDGVTSHQRHTIVEAADRHDVTLFCLPSHTTHDMQLMDQSAFGPPGHY